MIEVRIPKEIREYKEKMIAGLNLRQCICAALAIGISVPTYLYGKAYINEEIMSWIVVFIAMPLALIGFFKYNDMPFERFLLLVIKSMIFTQKRKYEELDIYSEIRKEMLSDECKRKGQGKIKQGKKDKRKEK